MWASPPWVSRSGGARQTEPQPCLTCTSSGNMPVRSHSALAESIGVASASLSTPLTGIKKRALLRVMRLTTLRGSCFYRGRLYFPSTLHRLISKDEWAKFSTHYHRILTQLTDGSSPHTGQWHARSRHSRPQKQKHTKDELKQKRGIRPQRNLRLHGTLFGVYNHNLDTLIVAKGAPRLLKAGSTLPTWPQSTSRTSRTSRR